MAREKHSKKRILPAILAAAMLLSATQVCAAVQLSSAAPGNASAVQLVRNNNKGNVQNGNASSRGSQNNGAKNANTTYNRPASQNSIYSDVSSGDWYYDSVQAMQKSGIMGGVGNGKFNPKGTVTGGMFLTLLGRILSVDVSSYTSTSDASAKYYTGYVAWAKDKGLLDDISDFNPAAALTREQICGILYQYMTSQGISLTSSDISGLADYASIDSAYRDAVSAMVGEGILKVNSKHIRPDNNTTRGEIAVILQRVAKVLGINVGSVASTIRSRSGIDDDANTTYSDKASTTYLSSLTATLIVEDEDKTSTGESISSSTADKSTVLVRNGGTLTMTGATITKSGDTTNTTYSSLYGHNSAVLIGTDSATTMGNTSITAGATGASAVFAVGSGASARVSDSTIRTTGTSSYGLGASYGGSITVSGTNLTTSGADSPVLYAAGKITASNITGTASASRAAVVKGNGAVTVTSSTLYGNGSGLSGYDSAVLLYQTSGSATATGTFTATGSTLGTTNDTAALFYVTNTKAVVNLTGNTLDFDSGVLVRCAGNSVSGWGTSGKNGGSLILNAYDTQALTGSIVCDSQSYVTLNLKATSTYKGAINSANTGHCSLSIASGAAMTLTGDCYLSSFRDADTDYSNITFNGYHIYVNGTSIN